MTKNKLIEFQYNFRVATMSINTNPFAKMKAKKNPVTNPTPPVDQITKGITNTKFKINVVSLYMAKRNTIHNFI